MRRVRRYRCSNVVLPHDDLLVEAGAEQEATAVGELDVGDEVLVALQCVRERSSAHVPDENVAEAGSDERTRVARKRRCNY